MPATLSVAQIVPCTEAEGPGKRFALWVQGCPMRCPGCCNPEFLPFTGGQSASVNAVLATVAESQLENQIEGVSFLGGEPFSQAEALAELAHGCQTFGLTVMVYTGYTLEQLDDLGPAARQLIDNTDLLVDGPYLKDRPETGRRWIGSTNQRIHFLTDKYTADDPCWTKPNTLEIRLIDGALTVNGFPATGPAVGLWKGRTRAR